MSQEKEAVVNLALIKKLQIPTNQDHSIFDDERGVIELPPLKGRISNRYYAVDKNHFLGKGGFGVVYEARQINPQTGVILEGAKPLAVKIFHSKTDADKKEIVDIQKRYFRNTQLIEDTQRTFLVTELLPGLDLEKFIKTREFAAFTFEQRIELLQQIILALNLVQNETPSTGESLMHSDLKLDNIMVSVDKSKEKIKINAHIIDFGLSRVREDEEVSLNNDIYCLGIITQVVLRESVGVIPTNIQDLATQFSSRMASFKQQPDSDECLRFFTEMRKYSQLHHFLQETKNLSEKRVLENDLNICQAKLELLANNDWTKEIGAKPTEKWKYDDSKNIDTNKTEARQTVGNFLESFPEMAPMVANLFKTFNKAEWFLSFLQKISEFLHKYPKIEMLIAAAYQENKENPTKFGVVLTDIKEFLAANPKMEGPLADLGLDKLHQIEDLAASKDMRKFMTKLSQAGLLNSEMLSVLEYVKDKPELIEQIKTLPLNVEALQKWSKSVQIIGESEKNVSILAQGPRGS